MNIEEQRQVLGGILGSLGRALRELDNAMAEAHRLRDGAGGGGDLSDGPRVGAPEIDRRGHCSCL